MYQGMYLSIRDCFLAFLLIDKTDNLTGYSCRSFVATCFSNNVVLFELDLTFIELFKLSLNSSTRYTN